MNTNLKAILTDKAMSTGGFYCVIATCSGCDHDHFVAFAGWSALKCHGCKGYMERTSYRKADTGRAAVDLLIDMPGGVNPARVAKLAAVLAAHPGASLETCGDESTGRRYGEAACRRGRAVKIGSSGSKYQIWAVWPAAVQG